MQPWCSSFISQIAFLFLYLCFKINKRYANFWRYIKFVRMMNFCWSQHLFSAIIQKPMEKSKTLSPGHTSWQSAVGQRRWASVGIVCWLAGLFGVFHTSAFVCGSLPDSACWISIRAVGASENWLDAQFNERVSAWELKRLMKTGK